MGYEQVEETENPEIAINRAMQTYLKKGYSREWINQRLKSIEIRKELTDEWEKRGAKEGLEFAILTDEITKAWAGFTTKEYKKFKTPIVTEISEFGKLDANDTDINTNNFNKNTKINRSGYFTLDYITQAITVDNFFAGFIVRSFFGENQFALFGVNTNNTDLQLGAN